MSAVWKKRLMTNTPTVFPSKKGGGGGGALTYIGTCLVNLFQVLDIRTGWPFSMQKFSPREREGTLL